MSYNLLSMLLDFARLNMNIGGHFQSAPVTLLFEEIQKWPPHSNPICDFHLLSKHEFDCS